MGPNNGTPNLNRPPQPQGGNTIPTPNQLPQYNVGYNTTPNSGREQMNQAPMSIEQNPAYQQMPQPVQVVSTATPTSVTAQPVAAISPARTKSDLDQLEREWVDKTKTTINANQSDPYELAHQVALLMKGYLKVRYGKIVGK